MPINLRIYLFFRNTFFLNIQTKEIRRAPQVFRRFLSIFFITSDVQQEEKDKGEEAEPTVKKKEEKKMAEKEKEREKEDR